MIQSNSCAVFGLYGAGGFAREVMPMIMQRHGQNIEIKAINYVVTLPENGDTNGLPIISEADFFEMKSLRRK